MWLTTEEISKELNVTTQTVRLWARQGKFKYFKVANTLRIDKESYENFKTKNTGETK